MVIFEYISATAAGMKTDPFAHTIHRNIVYRYNELSRKPGFKLYQSRHCAHITYSVKTWFLKILSVAGGFVFRKHNAVIQDSPCRFRTLNHSLNKDEELVPKFI